MQTIDPGMLSPFSAKIINADIVSLGEPKRATFELIDDDGNIVKGNRSF